MFPQVLFTILLVYVGDLSRMGSAGLKMIDRLSRWELASSPELNLHIFSAYLLAWFLCVAIKFYVWSSARSLLGSSRPKTQTMVAGCCPKHWSEYHTSYLWSYELNSEWMKSSDVTNFASWQRFPDVLLADTGKSWRALLRLTVLNHIDRKNTIRVSLNKSLPKSTAKKTGS